jgi:hypothetical protein
MRISDLAAWAIIAAAFLGVLLVLASPTGSLVRTPLEHTIQARPAGSTTAVSR